MARGRLEAMGGATPHLAVFSARFQLMLQYRTAAIAGFVTQCWWGGIKVMIYAAFYRSSAAAADAPITLAQVITYTWLTQGFFALLPWLVDPEVALAVRNGSIAYDRLRPVDTYAYWYSRSAAWMISRLAPRIGLMFLAAGVALPLAGLTEWAWAPPPSAIQAGLFAVSILLAAALSVTVLMLLNIVVAATLNERGVSVLAQPVVIILSGSLIPLPLFPDALRTFLLVQPMAGLQDIPFRIYSGALAGQAALTGLLLQAFWTVALVAAGRFLLGRTMRRLEVQGG
jgi:ABC-2 type transport system permease protein